MPNTIETLTRAAAQRFTASDSPLLDAQVLLAAVLGKPRSHLLAWPERAVAAEQVAQFATLSDRRAAGQPIAYLTGVREFWSLTLQVTPDTLVPRPETELLVEQALAIIPVASRCRVADIGTGSGAVAVAIGRERPLAQIVATDLSASALKVARRNAARHTTGNIDFRQGDWLTPLAGEQFHVVVSNPPYVCADDSCLRNGDTAHEPAGALASGLDGLDALRQICAGVAQHLLPEGRVLLEHGATQGQAVAVLLKNAGLRNILTRCDLAGHPRCTEGQR